GPISHHLIEAIAFSAIALCQISVNLSLGQTLGQEHLQGSKMTTIGYMQNVPNLLHHISRRYTVAHRPCNTTALRHGIDNNAAFSQLRIQGYALMRSPIVYQMLKALIAQDYYSGTINNLLQSQHIQFR